MYIYPDIKNNCLFYSKYIDFIFSMYPGGVAKVNYFLTNLYMMHNSIKFDHRKSMYSIVFLDIVVYINRNRQLQTTLHTKPTNTHNHLHERSFHPKHFKDSLLNSPRRIYTDDNELKRQSDKFKQRFSP